MSLNFGSSNTLPTTYSAHERPFTSIDSVSTYDWHSNEAETSENGSISTIPQYSPKHCAGETGLDRQRICKRARHHETPVSSCSYPSTMRSDDVDDVSGLQYDANLISAQHSTITLTNILGVHDDQSLDLDGLDVAGSRCKDPRDNNKRSSGSFWRPEAALLAGTGKCIYDKETAGNTGLLGCAPSPSIASDEVSQNQTTTPFESVPSVSSERSPTVSAVTVSELEFDSNETATFLLSIFPVLPPHLDPADDDIPSHKVSVQPNDLYNPKYIRNNDIATRNKREGWCGFCQRWLQLRESIYNYDKKYSHGICPSTGRPFDVPVKIRWSVSGRRTAPMSRVRSPSKNCGGYFEGRCGECDRWIRLVGRSGPANSWWRHAFQVCPLPSSSLILLHLICFLKIILPFCFPPCLRRPFQEQLDLRQRLLIGIPPGNDL